MTTSPLPAPESLLAGLIPSADSAAHFPGDAPTASPKGSFPFETLVTQALQGADPTTTERPTADPDRAVPLPDAPSPVTEAQEVPRRRGRREIPATGEPGATLVAIPRQDAGRPASGRLHRAVPKSPGTPDDPEAAGTLLPARKTVRTPAESLSAGDLRRLAAADAAVPEPTPRPGTTPIEATPPPSPTLPVSGFEGEIVPTFAPAHGEAPLGGGDRAPGVSASPGTATPLPTSAGGGSVSTLPTLPSSPVPVASGPEGTNARPSSAPFPVPGGNQAWRTTPARGAFSASAERPSGERAQPAATSGPTPSHRPPVTGLSGEPTEVLRSTTGTAAPADAGSVSPGVRPEGSLAPPHGGRVMPPVGAVPWKPGPGLESIPVVAVDESDPGTIPAGTAPLAGRVMVETSAPPPPAASVRTPASGWGETTTSALPGGRDSGANLRPSVMAGADGVPVGILSESARRAEPPVMAGAGEVPPVISQAASDGREEVPGASNPLASLHAAVRSSEPSAGQGAGLGQKGHQTTPLSGSGAPPVAAAEAAPRTAEVVVLPAGSTASGRASSKVEASPTMPRDPLNPDPVILPGPRGKAEVSSSREVRTESSPSATEVRTPAAPNAAMRADAVFHAPVRPGTAFPASVPEIPVRPEEGGSEVASTARPARSGGPEVVRNPATPPSNPPPPGPSLSRLEPSAAGALVGSGQPEPVRATVPASIHPGASGPEIALPTAALRANPQDGTKSGSQRQESSPIAPRVNTVTSASPQRQESTLTSPPPPVGAGDSAESTARPEAGVSPRLPSGRSIPEASGDVRVTPSRLPTEANPPGIVSGPAPASPSDRASEPVPGANRSAASFTANHGQGDPWRGGSRPAVNPPTLVSGPAPASPLDQASGPVPRTNEVAAAPMANQAQGDLRRGEARRTATVGIAPDSGETASRRLSVPTSADSGGSLPSTVASPTRSIPRQEVSAAPGNRGPEGANGVGIPWPAAFRAPARFHAADPGLNPALQPSDVPTPTRFERRARGTPGADVRPIVERTDRFPATPSAPSVRSFSRTSDSLPDGGATRVREAGTDAMREGMRGEMRGETHGDLRGERAGGRPANGAVPEDPTRLDVRSSRPRTVGEAPVGRPLMADSVASAVSGRGEVQRNPAPREGGIPPLTSAERPATPIPARMAYVPEAAPTATPSRSWDVTDRGGPGGAPGLTGGRTDAGRDTAFPPSGRHPSSLVSPTSAPERVRETPRSRDAREPRAEGEAVDRSRGPAAEARGTGDSASSEVAKRESVETRGRQDTGMDGATAPAGSRTSRREAAEAFLAEVGTVSADAMLGMRKGRKSDKPARDEGPNLPGARQLSPSVPADRPGMPVAEAAGTGGVVARARQDIDWPQPVQRALSEPMLEGGLEGGEVIPTSSLSPAERVHRLESLIHREVMLVRRFGAETMSVVLRPDSETELMLNLRQMDGYVEAAVRCDRGDLGDLRGYWRELQETLAAQNVRLLPAPETLSHSSILEAPTHHGSRTSFGEDRPSRQADPDPNPERPGGESRQRSSSSETPSESPENPAPRRAVRRAGWESWA